MSESKHEETAKRLLTEIALKFGNDVWTRLEAAQELNDRIAAALVEAERERDEVKERYKVNLGHATREIKDRGDLIETLKAERNRLIDEASQLRADHDAAEAKGVKMGLKRARELALPWAKCRCDSAYTDRGRHESNAPHEYADEIVGALDAEIAKLKDLEIKTKEG